MNKPIEKPHLIFLTAIPIVILMGVLSKDAVLDINIHDTYYIIEHLFIAILISILFGIMAFGYWIMQKTNRSLSKWLNAIHVIFTFGGMLLILILSQLFRESVMAYKFNENLTLVIYVIVLIIFLGQIAFPINMISGIIKKKNKSKCD